MKRTLASILLLRRNAGPRDGDLWATRLKEEYISQIKVRKKSWTSKDSLAWPDPTRKEGSGPMPNMDLYRAVSA